MVRNWLPATLVLTLTLFFNPALATEQLVARHGAIPDDRQFDTEAIQAAIDAAAKVGGGTVRFPSGTFLSGGLQLKSNVTLQLDKDAVLKGSTNHRDYGEGRWSKALIQGDGLKNIGIRGPGTIDGADCKNPDGEEGFRGPHGILLTDCQDITISNVTIQRTGNYAVLCRRCRDAQLEKVIVRGGHDGLHAQACRDFQVRACDFRTGDDCYAGCDNVNFKITGCQINSSCNGFRLGCVDLLVKECKIWGPGEYQHQVSSRKNMLSAFVHFAPKDRKPKLPSDNWLIEDVTMDNVGFVYGYDIERGLWQKGQPAKRLLFRNIQATNVERPIRVLGDADQQFELTLDKVSISLREDRRDQSVLDVKRFGTLTLRNTRLENSGTKPAVRASKGNQVRFEGVTIVPKNDMPYAFHEVDDVAGLAAEGIEDGFVSLFNGQDLTGWDCLPDTWKVQDGAICSSGTKNKKNWIVWRGGELKDFELRLKFKFTAGNSGVQVRSREITPFMVRGYQVEVAPREHMGLWHHSLAPAKYRSHLATAGQKVHIAGDGSRKTAQVAEPAEVQKAYLPAQWNELTIIARGPHLIQKVNGRVFAELTDEDAQHASREGLLALQDHGGGTVAAFKDIRLKSLTD